MLVKAGNSSAFQYSSSEGRSIGSWAANALMARSVATVTDLLEQDVPLEMACP
jgi:hypothetical protein